MRYDRADIDSTMQAALSLAAGDDVSRMVYATANGFTIETEAPVGIGQNYYLVNPDGTWALRNTWTDKGNFRPDAIEQDIDRRLNVFF